jgi:Zn-dependent protease with chaperone function
LDFFGRQELMRRNTRRLIALFALAVLGITLAIYTVVRLLFGAGGLGEPGGGGAFLQPDLLGIVAGCVLLLVGVASLFRVAELRHGGGRRVAEMLGGRLVAAGTREPRERQLQNVVAEVAIASGVPVPPVYVLDEDGVNAFAAGYRSNDAVVAVTRGCLEQLNRDELQGVVAHEFSHVLNGDMRLNIRLLGTLFGITCLATAGQVLLGSMRHARAGRRGGAAVALFGLALVVIGWIGSLCAALIRAAVSRKREFLADAAAVQFTRNPAGIAGALRKIGGWAAGGRIDNAHAAEASHMFFAAGLGQYVAGMFATHPPLSERIRAIEGGRVPLAPRAPLAPAAPAAAAAPARADMATGAPAVTRWTPDQILAVVGRPSEATLDMARDWLGRLPLAVASALHESFGARAVVLALLLDDDPAARRQQLERLRGQTDAPTLQEVLALHGAVATIPRAQRLAVVDLALPALRELSPEQQDRFAAACKLLIAADQRVTLLEFALQQVVVRNLTARARAAPPRITHRGVGAVLPECVIVLSALAHAGGGEPAARTRAFDAGFKALPHTTLPEMLPLRPEADCGPSRLEPALDELAQSTMDTRRVILKACATVAASDGTLGPDEHELLRAIADTLDCPLPLPA